MDKMEYYLYYFLVFISIFQDFFLVNSIGEFGRTPLGIIILPLFLILAFFVKRLVINKYVKVLIILEIYLVAVNVISLFIYIAIFNNSITILGENIIMKAMKGNFYFIAIIMYIIIINTLQESINIKKILKPFVTTFYFLAIILIIELITMPYALPYFHNKLLESAPYYRIRLTTVESSWTASLIIVYFSFTYYYYSFIQKSAFKKGLSVMILITFIVTSGSKGLFGVIIISLLGLLVLAKGKIKTKLLTAGLGGGFLMYIYPTLQRSIISDINNYTSIVSRVYTSVIGLLYGLIFPFGAGNALYLEYFPKMLHKYIHKLQSINITVNLSEIYSYIYSTSGSNISPKTGVLQYNMYWGIVGTTLFLVLLMEVYKKFKVSEFNKGLILEFGLIAIIILILTTITFEIKYDVWLFLAVVLHLTQRKTKSILK
jgi:hypothetical protein